MTLDLLKIGETAKVVAVNCQGFLRTRLADLGLLPGTPIEAVTRSPLGDPTAYEVRGSVIAIRNEDAQLIEVERER
jgi:Fe2+ transport system protein FeoA